MNSSGFIVLIPFFGIIFLSILGAIISQKYVPAKSKYNKLHAWSIAFLIFGFISMATFGVIALINRANKSADTNVTTADGFTIEEYKVILDVNESNVVNVKEYITVDFYTPGHHGIYRFIPSWLEYTSKDGITESRQSKLSNLIAVGENYTIDTVSGKQRIKIGNANYILPTGEHSYEINYTYDMGFDPYENFDEFIFHAFGDYWGTEIKNATIVINMPKEFDSQSKIKFFADKYRKKDITSYVDYHITGSTIYASVSKSYDLNSALTIDIELPNEYFVNGSNNYGKISLTLCSLCIIFTIISFVLWVKNGKDLDKVPETVEFYPPENLDAAEIGYIYKKDTGRKLSIALIIELASKGFIKIFESEDKLTQTIIKSNITDVNKYINREVKVIKLKDYKMRLFDAHYNSLKIMQDYFPDNTNGCVVTSNFDSFYEDAQYLIDNDYIKIESDSISKYTPEQLDAIKTELLAKEFKDKPQMTSNEKLVYDKLFEEADETVLSENRTFYNVFAEVGKNVRNTFDDKINDLTAYKYMLISGLGFLICTILWGLAYCIFEDLDPKLNIIYTIAFITNIITFILTILMKRKNSYGEQIKAKINGFRNYIELAEKNQIEMQVEKNPNYFYDILPFAYVLNVSKKWVEKFENIPIPAKDMGNFDYYNIDSLDSLSNSVYIPSSGSSGGGGGCSSCGGGCSSCGGGGSW